MKNIIYDRSRSIKFLIGIIITFIFMVVMNFLANYLPLNDTPTEAISDQYYNIFTPAGFTFAIWGVIYLALTVLVIFLIRGILKNKERTGKIVLAIGPLFIISSILNGVWLFAWHYDRIPLSTIIMLGLLLSLILLYRNLKDARVEEGLYLLPFSIYLGWISVATVANIVILTEALNWGRLGLSPEFWLTLLLLVIIALTAFMVLKESDTAFGLVILWALIGITSARWSDAGGLSYAAGAVIVAALAVIIILGKKLRQPAY